MQHDQKIALIQISGLDRTGKSTFINKTLGLADNSVHFNKPMFYDTPVGTMAALSEMLAEMSGHPAQRDWLNEFQIWDRGLMDPFAYDGCRGALLSEAQFKAVYDVSLRILGPAVKQIFMVATEPISDEAKDDLDAYYKPHRELLKARYLRAVSLLRTWGAEVYTFRSFTEAAPAVMIRDLFRKGEMTGFNHDVNRSGTIRVNRL